MGFGDAVRSALNKYATFAGRARRAEYWWFALFNILVSIAAGILDRVLFSAHAMNPGMSGPLNALAGLALLLPGLALWCRRLHDVGRSGWWWLLVFIPVIGWVVLFYWSVRRGDVGPNDYGPDPINGGGDGYVSSAVPKVTRRP